MTYPIMPHTAPHPTQGVRFIRQSLCLFLFGPFDTWEHRCIKMNAEMWDFQNTNIYQRDIFLKVQQIILECGLWSWPEAVLRLCSCLTHLVHQPQTISKWQSPLDGSLLVFSFHQLPLCSVPRAPHLTTVSLSLPGKIKELLPCQRTIPVPSSYKPTIFSRAIFRPSQ